MSVADADEPYWLVMGQSFNPGWHATTADGTDLGPPTLINGFANGWLVNPGEVGPDAKIVIEWTPQRTVWIALALSLIGLLVTLGMAFFDPKWLGGRVNRPSARVSHVVPLSPLDRFGAPRSWVRAGLLGLGAAVVGVLAFGLPVGLIAGAFTALVLRYPSAWPALRVVGIGGYGLGGLFVIAKQIRNGYELGFEWPNLFSAAHGLVLVSLALLAVDVVVEGLVGGWRRTVDDDFDREKT